jgi:hypothetical protein
MPDRMISGSLQNCWNLRGCRKRASPRLSTLLLRDELTDKSIIIILKLQQKKTRWRNITDFGPLYESALQNTAILAES